jgi:hypothetical protein
MHPPVNGTTKGRVLGPSRTARLKGGCLANENSLLAFPSPPQPARPIPRHSLTTHTHPFTPKERRFPSALNPKRLKTA